MAAQDSKKAFFVVEGNIGAGKSTFLRLIKNYLDVHIIYEPCSKWQCVAGDENLLDHFYRDTPRWAYTFQTYAFVTRVLEVESHARQYNNPIHVLERSVFSDRYCFAKNCFEMNCMSGLEWKLYQDWFAWLVDNYVQIPTGFVYLRVDPEISMSRLQKRNRSEEVGVTLDYLQKLHAKHDEWMVQKEGIAPYLKDIPVLVLDCNNDFEENTDQLEKHMQNVVAFMQKYASDQACQAALAQWDGRGKRL
jgi:deoxyguanosine kinase